jgi:hypothetical protein
LRYGVTLAAIFHLDFLARCLTSRALEQILGSRLIEGCCPLPFGTGKTYTSALAASARPRLGPFLFTAIGCSPLLRSLWRVRKDYKGIKLQKSSDERI